MLLLNLNSKPSLLFVLPPDGPEAPMVTGEKAVELNHPVKLTCSAASVPPANFTWKLNGTMTNVKTAVYAIDKAVYNSAGTYTCMALNSVTGKTTTYNHTLSVKGKIHVCSLELQSDL